MSGFSSPEFILILVLGLVVLGPKRLPEIASKIGGWVGQARRMTRVMKRTLEDELHAEEIKNIGKSLKDTPPDPKAAPDSSDPAYDDSDYAEEESDADHIPNEDDTFSPLHDETEDDSKKDEPA
ncbi:MAG: Sec-independent protein translocase subunit TatA/TatB [Woeseiaceae bacterium]